MDRRRLRSAKRRRQVTSAQAIVAALLVLPGCGGKSTTATNGDQLYVEAQQAIAEGDLDGALTRLSASIDDEPTTWALVDRAKIYAQQGADEAALADVEEVLKLSPGDKDAAWIKGELGKPAAKRFQGDLAAPPSRNR